MVPAHKLDSRLGQYDLERITAAIKPERDLQFTYLGLQTLYDRYFIHSHGTRFELPQAFFMRVAMGLAINEIDRESRAIEFYEPFLQDNYENADQRLADLEQLEGLATRFADRATLLEAVHAEAPLT